ncbi:hypothetical protein BH10PLA1_BH10PLA1_22480 [soil metagenome]
MGRFAVVIGLLWCAAALAQSTLPATTSPATETVTTLPANAPTTRPAIVPSTLPATTTSAGLSDKQLLSLCQHELLKQFQPEDSAKYVAAHDLLESFFAAATQKDRAAIITQLESTGLDANILGRLTRIRRAWQELSPGTYYINDTFGRYEVRYFLGVPKTYTRMAASPLVIVLPTADAFLAKPPPDNLGVTKIYRDWMTEELDRHHDALVLMPLLNLDELYGPSRAGMNSVIQPMLHAADQVNIDPQRVYLMGHSLGAHAVWNIALHYPTYFAAIAPLAGGANEPWQRVRLMNLSNILPVVWHDADDVVIPVDASRSLIRVLQNMKLDVQYTETTHVGHVPPPQVINQICETMRARSRELYPADVSIQSNRREAAFNRLDWVQMYQPIRPGPEQSLRLQHGTGPMVINQNTCSIKAVLAGNKVTATTDNVEVMRFYFNDQMVNFKQPVVVAVNGRVRFEGFLKPNIGEMLKDQIFLGRGWRYFTSYVEVDFGGPPSIKPTSKPTTRSAK